MDGQLIKMDLEKIGLPSRQLMLDSNKVFGVIDIIEPIIFVSTVEYSFVLCKSMLSINDSLEGRQLSPPHMWTFFRLEKVKI